MLLAMVGMTLRRCLREFPPRRCPSRLSCFVLLALVASLAAPAAAHTTNRGKATFTVADDGAVAVRIDMELRDLQEILQIRLIGKIEESVLENNRVEALRKLKLTVPKWLRLHGDNAACPVASVTLKHIGAQGVRVDAVGRCQALPKTLRIDWGLSQATGFDLVAVTLVAAPSGIRHTAVLSKQENSLEVVMQVPSFLTTLGSFVRLGLEHIVFGWDHLLFLLGLVLACATWRRLLLIVSGFTVAHSVTLALGATGVVTVRPELVEPVIAASIAAIAIINGWRLWTGRLDAPGSCDPRRGRPRQAPTLELGLTLAFGLVHGLGFASMLQATLGNANGFVVPLVGFNVGVELGQVALVALAFPLLVVIGRTKAATSVFFSLFSLLAAVGAYAAVARVLLD